MSLSWLFKVTLINYDNFGAILNPCKLTLRCIRRLCFLLFFWVRLAYRLKFTWILSLTNCAVQSCTACIYANVFLPPFFCIRISTRLAYFGGWISSLNMLFFSIPVFHVSFHMSSSRKDLYALSLIRLHRNAYGNDLQSEEKNAKTYEWLIPHRARASKLIKLKYAVRSEITIFLWRWQWS